MLNIQADSLNEAWLTLLRELYERPEHTPAPRGLKTHEILGVTLRVNQLRNNILYHPARNLNTKFMCAEWLWISFGQNDLSTLSHYNSQMSRFSDDGLTLSGAYGPRLQPQWDYVIRSLQKDYFSRQGVAAIWRPNPASSRDIVCTIALQFIARLGMLNCIVTMRSSDIWLGLPYDVFSFGQLANSVAGVLGLHTGFIQFNLGSSHLYSTDFEKAKQVLESDKIYGGIQSPILPGWPPIELAMVLQRQSTIIDEQSLTSPWRMYADILNADSWASGYKTLSGKI